MRQDFSKFSALKPHLLEAVDLMLANDIARLMAMIPQEALSTDSIVKGKDHAQICYTFVYVQFGLIRLVCNFKVFGLFMKLRSSCETMFVAPWILQSSNHLFSMVKNKRCQQHINYNVIKYIFIYVQAYKFRWKEVSFNYYRE